jgi:hypothetical protein
VGLRRLGSSDKFFLKLGIFGLRFGGDSSGRVLLRLLVTFRERPNRSPGAFVVA